MKSRDELAKRILKIPQPRKPPPSKSSKVDAPIWEGRPAGRRRPDQRGSLIDLYASIGSVFLEHYVDRLYHFLVLIGFAINNNLMLQVLRAFGL